MRITWPELTGPVDPSGWRAWLEEIWQGATADAIQLASPVLAQRVEAIRAGRAVSPKVMRRAVVSVVRYLLREASRPTPFGLFAGVADLEFSDAANTDTNAAEVRWGEAHRAVARADDEWLNQVITELEACTPLLQRLPVAISTLRQLRGDRLTVPSGSGHVDIRYSPAVRAVEAAASTPIVFEDLAASLAERFPSVAAPRIVALLTELLHRRFLVSCLRAPATTVDALGHLVEQLRRVGAAQIAPIRAAVAELEAVHAELQRHNDAAPADRAGLRNRLDQRMRALAHVQRSPLVVDLRLDCEVRLPGSVARDMAAAASALLRLTAQPGGWATWREYHAAFLDRYGTGALVPISEVLDPGTGLGYPGGYPGALIPEPAAGTELQNRPAGRDAGLLALAHRAIIDDTGEVVLDDSTIDELGADMQQVRIPPHVEISARIHAVDLAALQRGDYTLTVAPARAAGTMTGRFTGPCSPLARVFARVPTAVRGAVAAQVSVPMAYPHADNVARTHLFVPHLIALGEHRAIDGHGTHDDHDKDGDGGDGPCLIGVDDLAITADFDQLYLVSRRLGRVVEPHVFHALRLDKQPPPLARFLVALVRGRTATYTEFDWGAADELPYLPRVRYGRCVLAPARWRVTADDLPGPNVDWPSWTAALKEWRRRWRTPAVVEMREDDRALRLDLNEPAHVAVLRDHLHRAGHAVLVEAHDPAGDGWLHGHAHQVAAVMLSTRPPMPSPLAEGRELVTVTNTHGQLPGAPNARWLSAKLYAPPDLYTQIIATHLPTLLEELADTLGRQPDCWWLRYRDPTDPDHLRLRLAVTGPQQYGACAATVGGWADRLCAHRLARRLTLDTYYPEVGRYGDGPALQAAEQVFVADSAAVQAQLALPEREMPDPAVPAAANFIAIAAAFTGDTAAGMHWLINHATSPAYTAATAPLDRSVRAHGIALATGAAPLPHWETLEPLWQTRSAALTHYRRHLPTGLNADLVLASLLHMHHIRARGINRPAERQALLLARAAALSWRDRKPRQQDRP
ncbi:hypothetical protein Acsp04_66750 [Actinomadura sp. NBRC 104425]|nr:hypothetical protein Acsp04_66750 [Actinomadura sp. NBRC 104425]